MSAGEEELPDRVVLHASRAFALSLGVGVGLSGFSGVRSIPADMVTPLNGMTLRWVLGCLCAVLSFMLLTEGLFRLRRLVLDCEGFTERGLLAHKRRVWSEVSNFRVELSGHGSRSLESVEFDTEYGSESLSIVPLPPRDLVSLLSRFQERALVGGRK